MHIALLSDPNNFHTQKWGRALQNQGADVTVYSLEEDREGMLPAIQIDPPAKIGRRHTYLSYLWSGKQLAAELRLHRVDIVNAINITPFGVWARQSGFQPLISSAIGSDILEYPPKGRNTGPTADQKWLIGERGIPLFTQIKQAGLHNFYRRQVIKTLHRSNLVTADNEVLAESIRNWFSVEKENVKVLRWGIEEGLFKPDLELRTKIRQKLGIMPGEKLILSPRGAKPVYQAEIILDAFEIVLRKTSVNHRFLMLSAGYGITSEIRRKAKELSEKHPNFTFYEKKLSRAEMHQLWLLTDVFVSAPVYDGYSAALSEGRFVGAIPIVNAIPANLEVIRNGINGIVVDPFTASNFSENLLRTLDQLNRVKEQFQELNRRWIMEHSLIEHSAAQFIEWSEQLIGRRII